MRARPPIEVEAYGGAALPGGALAHSFRPGALYGGGLAKEWAWDTWQSLRLGARYTHAALGVRHGLAASGRIQLHAAVLRLDYLLGPRRVRPFLGGGVGLYPWSAQATSRSQNTGAHRTHSLSFGGQVIIGLDVALGRHLSISPEASWTQVRGTFNRSLWSTGLAVRWRA